MEWQGGGSGRRCKEPAWKIHVRHILSVHRDVFRLTADKDGKRRGRYHALDELAYADRLASKAQRDAAAAASAETPPSAAGAPAAKRRHKGRQHRGQVDATARLRTNVR